MEFVTKFKQEPMPSQGRSQEFSKGGGGGHRGYSPDYIAASRRIWEEEVHSTALE